MPAPSGIKNTQLPADAMKYLILRKIVELLNTKGTEYVSLKKIKFYFGYLCPKMNKAIKTKCEHKIIKKIYCSL